MGCRNPSLINATPLQNWRGIDCAAHGSTAVSRMSSMPTIWSWEFQKRASLVRKFAMIRSSAGPKSQRACHDRSANPTARNFFPENSPPKDV
jgi:hypothetical protein